MRTTEQKTYLRRLYKATGKHAQISLEFDIYSNDHERVQWTIFMADTTSCLFHFPSWPEAKAWLKTRIEHEKAMRREEPSNDRS